MALEFKGGSAFPRMLPLSKDTVVRLQWLRQREARLKAALDSGDLEGASQSLSELMQSAKPGDYNPTKAEAVQKAIQEARQALNRAQYSGNIVKQ